MAQKMYTSHPDRSSYQFLTWVPSHQKNCRKGYNTRTLALPLTSALLQIPKVGMMLIIGAFERHEPHGSFHTRGRGGRPYSKEGLLGSVGSTQNLRVSERLP